MFKHDVEVKSVKIVAIPANLQDGFEPGKICQDEWVDMNAPEAKGIFTSTQRILAGEQISIENLMFIQKDHDIMHVGMQLRCEIDGVSRQFTTTAFVW
jgi:hypothetical protein